MACQIKYNSEGISQVIAENGNPSLLFNSIVSSPFLNQEQALEAYKNIFVIDRGENLPNKTDVNQEPILYFKTPTSEVYSTYKEALDATETGDIEAIVITSDNISYNEDSFADVVMGESTIKINSDNAYAILFTVNSNSNSDSLQGFINQQIRRGTISDTTLLSDGQYKLKGAGESTQQILLNSVFAKDEASRVFGAGNVQRNDDGTLNITVEDTLELNYESGSISKERFLADLKAGKIQVLENRMGEDVLASHAYNIYRAKNNIFASKQKTVENIPNLSEEQLKNTLLNFLSKIGVNVTSIEDYTRNYALKNNVEVSANALADIGNKVVAFSQGQMTLDALSEEVAHFAVEAFQDQDLITRLEQNVHQTNEWKQYAEQYLAVYGKTMQGVELDTAVRREIIGKVLARKLQENFQDTQNTPVETGFSSILAELWNTFINRVRSLFTPSLNAELEQATNAIANNILNDEFEDVFSETTLNKAEFLFYSLADKKTSTTLQKYYNALQKAKVKNLPEINDTEQWIVLQRLNSSLGSPLTNVLAKVNDGLKKYQNGDPNQNKMYLDGETITAIADLQEVRPVLNEVLALVESGELEAVTGIDKNLFITEIQDKINKIDQVQRGYSTLSTQGTSNVVSRIVDSLGLPEKYTEKIKTLISSETKDITALTRWFGQPAYANNEFINILSKIFANNKTKAQISTQQDINEMSNFVSENSFDLKRNRTLVELDANGAATGRLISEVKMSEFLQDYENEKVRIIKQYVQDLKEDTSNKTVISKLASLSTEQRAEYDNQISKWLTQNTEKPFVETYYEELEANTAFMSLETKNFLKEISTERAAIKRKYRDPSQVMEDSDLLSLEAIARKRKEAKSLYREDGSSKEENTIEYRIAQDLIQADQQFAEKNKNKTATLRQDFVENLQALEQQDNAKALKWVKANGGYRFNTAYWEALGVKTEETENNRTPNIVRKLRNLEADLSEEDFEQTQFLSETIEEALNKRSDLLRRYQKTGNPSEVDVSSMSETAKATIRELDEQLEESIREANRILTKNEIENITSPSVENENTENLSFEHDLKDSGKNPYSFALENMSTKNKAETAKFSEKINNLLEGRSYNIEPKYKRFLASYYNLNAEELSDDEFVDEVVEALDRPNEVVLAYAKTKMYSYYKRFAPKGYSEFLEDLEEGKIAPSRLLNDRENLIQEYPAAQYIEITPNYLWNEAETTSQMNPNYNTNWEQGFFQPKLSKYANPEYTQRFGINEQGQATRNLEDFQMIEIYRQMNRRIAENYGDKVALDVNLLPQISKSQTDKIIDASRTGIGAAAKRSLKDIFTNRIDDMDYGMNDSSSNERTIPVKYIYQLEEASDVSLDLAYSFSESMAYSNLYKQRKNSIADVMAIQQQIAEQKFTNGKTGQNSNAYQMAENVISHNLFGVQQTRKLEVSVLGRTVDLSRLATVLHRTLQWGALAFSPVIAITNFFTGAVNQNLIEARLGQFIRPESNTYAIKEFTSKQLPTLLQETGKLNRSSKIYKALEAAGVIDLKNRTKGSNLGWVGIAFNNLGYEGYLAGDIAIKSQVFIATFDDYRNVEGTGFLTYDQYKLRTENEGLTKKEIQAKWDTLREGSLWNALQSEGTAPLKINEQYINTYGQEYMDNLYVNALQKASATSAQIDGQITDTEKNAASRDFMLRFTTSMRGWLFSLIQNRLQGRKYNLLQGQEIEGSYITSSQFLNNIVKKMIDDRGITGLISAVKHEWAGMDDFQKANMKRVLADFAVFLTMLGVAALAMAGSDDDDSYLYTFATYTLIRVTSETQSQSNPVGGILDALEKPILATGFIKQLYKGGLFEDVQTGKYEGTPKLVSLMIKNSPLKQIYDLSDIKATRDQYRGFNENLLFLSSDKETEEFLNYFKNDEE